LNKFDIKDPVLFGHSFGASIILKYCVKYGRAKKLILSGAAGIRRQTNKLKYYKFLAKVAKNILKVPLIRNYGDSLKQKTYQKIGSLDYLEAGVMKGTYKKVIAEDLTNDLDKIKIPTILFWGEDDQDTPLTDGMLMKAKIKGAKLFIIKNAGHFAFIDQSAEFKRLFIEELI